MNTQAEDKSLLPASSAHPASSIASRHRRKSRRHSLSFSFPPLFQSSSPSASSTSLIPSTAEGRPIPLDDDTAAHRTSALREISRDYPSRHRYAKSTGAQSSTYSQPVIVHTYSGPSSRPASTTRGGRPASAAPRLKYPFSTSAPTSTYVRNGGPGLLSSSMVRTKHLAKNRKGGSSATHEPAKLPPVEAFSFKSFMADVDLQTDIGTDLDRIAEICARSRYSLSNQYEVHMAPHGSGAQFLASAGQGGRGGNRAVGPTLQAVSSDDERGHRKRRSTGRRRSVAYGTLETIMSSSRSNSEEGKNQKKGAAELADEVRGRAARKEMVATGDTSSRSGSSKLADAQAHHMEARHDTDSTRLAWKKSASFANAIMDTSRHHVPPVPVLPGDSPRPLASPRNSTGALHSDPALPQTSNSHLEIRTAPGQNGNGTYLHESQPQSPAGSDHDPMFLAHLEEPTPHNTSFLSGFSSWIPWGGAERPSYPRSRNGAEGSLRELLRYSESKGKGKGVDRT